MSVEAMTEAAEQIRAGGTRYVVVKGGHLTDAAHDVVAGPEGITVLEAVRVVTGNDHGTGCSLSAAIAANLAHGSRRARGRAGGQGLRGPGPGRRGRLAARRGARAHRPFRVVGLIRAGGRRPRGRRFWVVPLNVGF